MDEITLESIKEHIAKTSFAPESEDHEYPMSLWTHNGEGLFSSGQEGFSLAEDRIEIDNSEDLEFMAKAPEYIRFLLSKLS